MNFFAQKGKPASEAALVYLQQDFFSASLVKGNFRQICVLPKHMDWSHSTPHTALDFFYYTNLFYESIAEFCTVQDCPTMSAGAGVDYNWTDSRGKTVKLPAPQYVDYFMTYAQNILNDQTVFPTKSGAEFPRDFLATIRQIHKQLIRVFVHMYSTHVHQIQALGLQGHINTLFAHILCFGKEFDLIDKKDLVPVLDFVHELDGVHSLGLK
ncbi:Maintenance of ploidy protein mob2 [Rhizoclosmatium hyalinum]|nr:Maintenance of ploidy protein mob2 [Rhizoclosmatium hyalinum]